MKYVDTKYRQDTQINGLDNKLTKRGSNHTSELEIYSLTIYQSCAFVSISCNLHQDNFLIQTPSEDKKHQKSLHTIRSREAYRVHYIPRTGNHSPIILNLLYPCRNEQAYKVIYPYSISSKKQRTANSVINLAQERKKGSVIRLPFLFHFTLQLVMKVRKGQPNFLVFNFLSK